MTRRRFWLARISWRWNPSARGRTRSHSDPARSTCAAANDRNLRTRTPGSDQHDQVVHVHDLIAVDIGRVRAGRAPGAKHGDQVVDINIAGAVNVSRARLHILDLSDVV